MLYPLVFAAGTLTIFVFTLWYWKRSPRFVAYLPGPTSSSWLVGNIPDFQRADNAAAADFEWTKKYGNAFHYKGCFGENILYVSDPKALQYILNTSGYNFPKSWEARFRLRLITGNGIVSAEGPQHARHRRVMNPSFSHSALKGYIPLFFDISARTKAAWRATICQQNAEKVIIDVSSLLTCTTLDAIGEAAFGYKFNSIEAVEPKTELQKAYENLLVDVNYMISDFTIVFRRLVAYSPLWLSDILISLPKKDMIRFKNYMRIARDVAKGIVGKKLQPHANGKEVGKDIMSILVKANNAEDPRRGLEEDEVLSQITTLMFAGHETTANTLSWALYELSKHPEAQRKLRDEITTARNNVASRGESEFTISDLDSMKYTIAVMKETLRYHPIVMQLSRRALRDDVIPLQTPQQTISGDKITTLPVRKGQVIQLGLASYNRLTEVWGQDADLWRPERFLEEKVTGNKTSIGVFGNLSTFSSGLRSCIGWRFSLIEMQVVLVDLIENFAFSPVPGIEIKRVSNALMQSMVKGQENKGTQMPLAVSLISRQDVP